MTFLYYVLFTQALSKYIFFMLLNHQQTLKRKHKNRLFSYVYIGIFFSKLFRAVHVSPPHLKFHNTYY